MNLNINPKKLIEAIEGVQNKTTITVSTGDLPDDAENIVYRKALNFAKDLSQPKDLENRVVILNDFGFIDIDKSKFHSRKELFNADIIIGSYTEAEEGSGLCDGKICFIYDDNAKEFVKKYLTSIKGEIKC